MAGTIDTTEKFPRGTAKARMDAAVKLRLKAGAISSSYTGSKAKGWTLITKWNLIGVQ